MLPSHSSERGRCISSFSPASSIGTSTESLISVLDHDSCESLLGCLEESIDLYLANQDDDADHDERNETDRQLGDEKTMKDNVELNRPQQCDKRSKESTNQMAAQKEKSTKSATSLKRIYSAPAKKTRAKSAPGKRPSTAIPSAKTQHNSKESKEEKKTESKKEKKTESNDNDSSEGGESLELTAWERWMLRKAAEERQKGEKVAQEQAEKEAARKLEAETQKQKQKRTQREIANWCQRKRIENEQQRQKSLAQAAAQAATENRRNETARKTDENFRAWLRRKVAQEAAHKQSEAARLEREEREKAARRAACEQEFEKWYKRSKNVSKSRSTLSLGAHSANNGPGCIVPSFYNPIPWQPNAIPRVKIDRKVSRSKYQWRPTQYT